MIDACSADIILLTEIWLSSTIGDREILHCETGYNYRSDRTGRLGGGVLIAARYSVISNVIIHS